MKRMDLPLIGLILILTALLLTGCNLGTITTTTPVLLATETSQMPVESGVDWAAYQPRPYNDQAVLIDIPGGTFTMGTDRESAELDEKPAHSVTLAAFKIYSHEVTNKMYRICVEAHRCMYPGLAGTEVMRRFSDPAYADFPVVGVDWHMARNYCEFTGGRLPTEAEWELAARGFDGITYPWGEELPTCDLLNMHACFSPEQSDEGGSYPDGKSPFELYDMAGNVWEWVNDWYTEDGYLTAGIHGPASGIEKAIRGGSYLSRPESVTTTVRQSSIPDRAFDDVGFRCVRNAGEIPPDIVVPPERHDPSTPPGGPDDPDDHDLEMTALEEADVACVSEDDLLYTHFKIMITGSPVIGNVELYVEDPATLTDTITTCMLWPVEPEHYQVLCNAPKPSSLAADFPPTWVNMELRVTLTDPSITLKFFPTLQIIRCAPPGGYGWALNTRLSCPDETGNTKLYVTNQYYSEVPEFINFAFDSWDMSTCTSFYAENFTCKGVLSDSDPHSLLHWIKFPSNPAIIPTGYSLYEPTDCPGTTEEGGSIFCTREGGHGFIFNEPDDLPFGMDVILEGYGELTCLAPDLHGYDCRLPGLGALEEVTISTCPYIDATTMGTCLSQTYAVPECPVTVEPAWKGSVVCSDTGGYSILLTTDTFFSDGVSFASGGGGLFECTRTDLTHWVCTYNPPDPPEPEATVQICPNLPDTTPGSCTTYHFPFPEEPCTPGGLYKVSLTSYGCDPARGNFFCILEVSIDGVTPDEYRVHTNLSDLTCTLISSPPDRIYCASGWNPAINTVGFTETEPAVDVSVNWSISPEACPTEPPPVTDRCAVFANPTICSQNNCFWHKEDGTCRSTL